VNASDPKRLGLKVPERQQLHVKQLILGGARSGKSAYALDVAKNTGLDRWMIVTCKPDDQEMQDRIFLHKAERGVDWNVIEENVNLGEVLGVVAKPDRIVVVDCLTLWLSNLFLEKKDIKSELAKLSSGIKALAGGVIFVTNEIGLGLVPSGALGRVFRDEHGRLNQLVAAECDEVTFIAAGIPLTLKKATRSDE